MADTIIFNKTALIGGGAGSLDLIDGNDRGDGEPLQEGDAAFVTYGGNFYFYILDEDVGGAESSPALIVPDTNAGSKRWVQQSIPISGYLAIADIDNTPVDNEVNAPISSNWAYDHAALTTAHGISGTNTGDETAARIATIITGAGDVAEPLDADEFPFYKIVGTLLKKVTWANIKATLKTYFDGLYNNYTHPSGDGNLHVPANSTTNEGKVLTAGAAAGTYTWETPSGGDFDPASPDAIGGTAPNTIQGYNKEIFKTASADSPLTAAQCAGTIVSNYGMTDADCVISLPTAAEGLAFVCILPAVRARYFRLDPAAGDSIYLSGVTTGDGKYVGVASGYAAATSASFFTFKTGASAYDWFCIPIFGTWVAEAA
jgi:hypothetical protein